MLLTTESPELVVLRMMDQRQGHPETERRVRRHCSNPGLIRTRTGAVAEDQEIRRDSIGVS